MNTPRRALTAAISLAVCAAIATPAFAQMTERRQERRNQEKKQAAAAEQKEAPQAVEPSQVLKAGNPVPNDSAQQHAKPNSSSNRNLTSWENS